MREFENPDLIGMVEPDYPLIRRAISNAVWAIQPDALDQLLAIVDQRSVGVRLTSEEIQGRIGAARRGSTRTAGAVAIVPIYGHIFPRANIMTESSGATSIQRFRSQFRDALNDEAVGSILLDVDSPGGAVDGVPEMADEILKARGEKPIVAHANTLSASAAYWLAVGADEIIASPSAMVGSIGVLAAHTDHSSKNELEGVKRTYIHAGRYKVEGNPDEALSEEALEHIQSLVDETYSMFVSAVAKGRGVTPKEVRQGYGEGRVFTSRTAQKMGMVDRIETFEDTIARLSGARRSRRGRRAEENEPVPIAISDSVSTEVFRMKNWIRSAPRKES